MRTYRRHKCLLHPVNGNEFLRSEGLLTRERKRVFELKLCSTRGQNKHLRVEVLLNETSVPLTAHGAAIEESSAANKFLTGDSEMEVILKEDVPKLGHRGEVVKVAEGYGRNYLLPHKLAIEATTANRAVIDQMKQSAVRKSAVEKTA